MNKFSTPHSSFYPFDICFMRPIESPQHCGTTGSAPQNTVFRNIPR